MTFIEVPGNWDVSIAGRGFMIDTDTDIPSFSRRTVPLLRRQFDISAEAGEGSLNPEGPWRRTIDTWYRGAGQVDQDGTDSRVGQFSDSRKIDVWTRGEARPLPESTSVGGRAVAMATTPTALYSLNDSSKVITRRIAGVENTITATASGSIASLTSDNESVWIAEAGGSGGAYRFDGALTTETKVATGNLNGVAYCGDRLIGWTLQDIYDLSSLSYAGSASALPSALLSLPVSSNQGWECATFAHGYIYFGTRGGKIYKTVVKPDGTGLDIPTVAAELPAGEGVYALYGYLGFVMIGTDRGYRLAVADDDGDLTLGATIEQLGSITNPAIVARGQYVYVTSTGGTSVNSGIRRIDLSVLNDTIPAYAADLWVDVSTNVYSVGFDGDDLYFGTSSNTYTASTTLSSSGWVETGEIDFGLTDDKVAKGLTADLASGSATFTLYHDEGSTVLGVATSTSPTLSIGPDIASRSFRVRAVLSADAVLRSFTLLAHPTGQHSEVITAPLVLAESMSSPEGSRFAVRHEMVAQDGKTSSNIRAQLEYLRGLRDQGAFVDYTEGGFTESVQVVSVDFLARTTTDDRATWAGTAVVQMKTTGIAAAEPVVPTAPAMVAAPVVTPLDGQLRVSWAPPFDGGDPIDNYTIRYSTDEVSWTLYPVGLVTLATFSATNGTEYYVQVRAENSIGDGDWSSSTTGTPAGLPDAPTGLTVVS